ncbi:hypothetical protein CkaCkLH20_08876 [Colletotrichum karsti]|uniref:Uncharacterized protein n=1 Tax=Colletotrichum karsti TaxID=1095194 RepID=A0A9P6LI11_9PEZI|nr:uncharacterized protein CkaCkLH20_08876 [Colletotrichum karsti]KAF9873766.1 hypothetical protein CkaCkLH20_08876 [Colletotrichum karsti]
MSSNGKKRASSGRLSKTPTKGSPAKKDAVIIIGIDFGTTYSGVSWVRSGQPNNIEVITNWETQMSYAGDQDKTPTKILYGGPQDDATWGYDIPTDTEREPLQWFKLLLVDQEDLPEHLRESAKIAKARKLVHDCNKDPVEVISGYLRLLWNHAIGCITKTAGPKLVQMSRFQVIITLPAIWPSYAKSRMRRAAEDAGVLKVREAGETTLSFIAEPEAAALATIRDLGLGEGRPDIEVGDHFVVCDAGGGTVDLISYEVLSLDPVEVRESIRGDGDLCGAVFLDEAFVELLKLKVTPAAWDNMSKEQAARVLHIDWENGIKKNFEGQDKRWNVSLPFECRIPGSSNRGVKRKRDIILNREDLTPVFDPIADKISALVNKQLAGVFSKSGKKPQHVMLVGGFGRCRYVRERLQQNIGDDISILQSSGHTSGSASWTAICRGAVIHGLARQNLTPEFSISVKSRVSRMSYGVTYHSKFNPAKHEERHKFWCPLKMVYEASHQVEWFLKRGDDVSTAEPVRFDWQMIYDTAPGKISTELSSSEAWPVPKVQDDTVKELCKVKWSKKIDFESLPTEVNPVGKVLRRLEFTTEMTCDGVSVDFTVIHGGKRVGAKNVEVVFKDEE